MRTMVAICLLYLSACATPSPTRWLQAEWEWGSVIVPEDSPDLVEPMERSFVRCQAIVAELLGRPVPPDVCVVVCDKDAIGNALGKYSPNLKAIHIEITQTTHPFLLGMVMGHEIAHSVLEENPWGHAPLAIHEGIAMYAGQKCVEDLGFFNGPGIDPDPAVLELKRSDLASFSDKQMEMATVHGHEIVKRIGLGKVMEMLADRQLAAAQFRAAWENAPPLPAPSLPPIGVPVSPQPAESSSEELIER